MPWSHGRSLLISHSISSSSSSSSRRNSTISSPGQQESVGCHAWEKGGDGDANCFSILRLQAGGGWTFAAVRASLVLGGGVEGKAEGMEGRKEGMEDIKEEK